MKEVFKIETLGNKDLQPASGIVNVEMWDKAARLKRALARAGLCFLVACLCVPLPIAHFVLVPSFLLATPCVFAYFYGKNAMVLDGETTCPNCKTKITLGSSNFNFPKKQMCDKCFHILKISLTEKRDV